MVKYLITKLPESEYYNILRVLQRQKFSVQGFRSPQGAPRPFVIRSLTDEYTELFLDEISKLYLGNIDNYDFSIAPDEKNMPGYLAYYLKQKNDDQAAAIYQQLSAKTETPPEDDAPLPDDTGKAAGSSTQPPAETAPDTENKDTANDIGPLPQPPAEAAPDTENEDADRMKKYLGFTQEIHNYINYYPLFEVQSDNTITKIDNVRQDFPNYGNINIYGPNRHDVGEWQIRVLSFLPEELEDNVRDDHTLNATQYKLSADLLLDEKRIANPSSLGLYVVVTPNESFAFGQQTRNNIEIYERDTDVTDTALLNLDDGYLYGPYKLQYADGEVEILIDRPVNGVVTRYQPKNGTIRNLLLEVRSGFDKDASSMYAQLDRDFEKSELDMLGTEEIISAFCEEMAYIPGVSGVPSEDAINRFLSSKFAGISTAVLTERCSKIQAFLEDREHIENASGEISKLVAATLMRYGNTDAYRDLLCSALDEPDVSRRIQSFDIVKSKIAESQDELDALKAQIANYQGAADAAKQSVENARGEQAVAVNQELKSENDQLHAEVARLNELVGLGQTKEQLAGVINYLNERKSALTKEVDDAKASLTQVRNDLRYEVSNTLTRLKSMNGAVTTAFDGMISDQLFEAAANWSAQDSAALYQRLAEASTASSANTRVISTEEIVPYILSAVKRYRPRYTRNDILNICICLQQNFLTVFSGAPGTGKTSICNIIAHVLGLRLEPPYASEFPEISTVRYVPVSVERGWTSKRDFIGFYNPLSKKFEQANKNLYDAFQLLDKENSNSAFPFMILLDEANLSSMEYYWADFMNICDNESLNNTISLGNDIILNIPHTLRFAATINNDHTTEALSPRLIDRAFIITMPEAEYAEEADATLQSTEEIRIPSWTQLQSVFGVSKPVPFSTTVNTIYTKIKQSYRKLKINISPRVEKAIRNYWITAQDLFETNSDGTDPSIIAFDYAVAQKLLPKINGSGVAYEERLEELRQYFENSNMIKSEKILSEILTTGKSNMKYFQYF